MRRVELLKQRQDLKIALRRAKNAIAKKDPPNEDYLHLEKPKDNVRTHLRRNLKKSHFKTSLRRPNQDPCVHNGDQWFTFSNPNCYNLLDEVVVLGTRSKKINLSEPKPKETPSTFSKYMNSIDWWDGSIKDPWPDSKWKWFEDRQSGDFVWGPNKNGNEGRKRGKNGKIYNSYQGDDLIPSGGGANLKFWAHKFNHLSHLLQGIRDGGEFVGQGHNLYNVYQDNSSNSGGQKRNLTSREKEYFLTHQDQDSTGLKMGVDTLYRFNRVLPKIEHWNGDFYKVGPTVPVDTILRKSSLKKILQLLEKQNRNNQERANEQFEKEGY